MNQLWEYTATDQFGNTRRYQAYAPSATQAHVLEDLRRAFPKLNITSLERVPDSAYKPPTGPVESHTFEFGAYRAAMAEKHPERCVNVPNERKLITRRPIVRTPIIPR